MSKVIIGTERTKFLDCMKAYNLPVQFKDYNPNPAMFELVCNIKTGGEVKRDDCSTRAMSIILQKPYDTILDEQLRLAREHRCSYSLTPIVDKIMRDHDFIGVKCEPQHMGLIFMLNHPKGSYLIIAAEHVYPLIDGCVYDHFYGVQDQVARFERLLSEPVGFYYTMKPSKGDA